MSTQLFIWLVIGSWAGIAAVWLLTRRAVGSVKQTPRDERAAEQQPLLMRHMLNRLGFRTARLYGGDFEEKVAELEKRCAMCREMEACRLWLAEGEDAEAYRAFCPNVEAFDALPRKLLEI